MDMVEREMKKEDYQIGRKKLKQIERDQREMKEKLKLNRHYGILIDRSQNMFVCVLVTIPRKTCLSLQRHLTVSSEDQQNIPSEVQRNLILLHFD